MVYISFGFIVMKPAYISILNFAAYSQNVFNEDEKCIGRASVDSSNIYLYSVLKFSDPDKIFFFSLSYKK